MWSLWEYCKQRYSSQESYLKAQADAMDPETRHSLTQKIVETLNGDPVDSSSDVEHGNDNSVEGMLAKIEIELENANTQLKTLEGKEEFLAVRIRKYQTLIKEQDEHLNSIKRSKMDVHVSAAANDEQQQQQPTLEEKLAKQQQNKQALGKVVDIHLTILKNIKDCQRTIATLEQKKFELTNVTKQCRDFLVMAEEVEREQQMGVEGGDHELQMVEQEQNDEQQPAVDTRQSAEDETTTQTPTTTSSSATTADLEKRDDTDEENQNLAVSPASSSEEEGGDRPLVKQTQQPNDEATMEKDPDTTTIRKEDVPRVEPDELTGTNLWQN